MYNLTVLQTVDDRDILEEFHGGGMLGGAETRQTKEIVNKKGVQETLQTKGMVDKRGVQETLGSRKHSRRKGW